MWIVGAPYDLMEVCVYVGGGLFTCAIWAQGFVVLTKWIMPPLPCHVTIFLYVSTEIHKAAVVFMKYFKKITFPIIFHESK